MPCAQYERALEEQEGSPLPEAALAHLETCEACRALTADFGAIRDLAAQLETEGIAPPERIWIALRGQLEAEGIIHASLPDAPAPEGASARWWAAFQRPAFAGSFLALLLAAASLVSVRWSSPLSAVHSQLALEQPTSSVPTAESVFEEEVRSVGTNSASDLQRADTAVADSIQRNLRIVDNLIAVCEKSVREQPENDMAREYLYGAYQQKAELLAAAMNRSMTGGLQ